EITSGDEGAREGERGGEDYALPSEDRGQAEGGSGEDGFQPDLYDNATSGSAGSAPDTLDGGLDNMFPDDAGPRAADAPELIGQWKSMPGGSEDGTAYDLDDFVASRKTLKDAVEEQIPFLLSGEIERLIARHLADQLDEAGYLTGS